MGDKSGSATRKWQLAASGLYHVGRPRMPREWLLPARLRNAFKVSRESCGMSGKRPRYNPGELVRFQPGEARLPELPGTPVTPEEADAWLSHLRWRGSQIDRFMVDFPEADELDVLEAFYTAGRTLFRYGLEAENAAGLHWIEEKAINDGNTQEAKKWLADEWLRCPGDPEEDRELHRVRASLRELEKTLPWDREDFDRRLCDYAKGARAERSSLRIVEGWVDPFAWLYRDYTIHPDDFDEVTGQPRLDEHGEMIFRVPVLERPPFVEPEAWKVPLCLWDDKALARFAGFRDGAEKADTAWRRAADRVLNALDLARPRLIYAQLDAAGVKIVRRTTPRLRRTPDSRR